MPDLRFDSQPPRHTDVPRPRRAEGQWSFGYREPLNKNEESKKNDDPLNVRDRILYVYSKRGFDSIDPADLRGRFRWLGLYTQRKPGIDGGKTGALEEEELDDRYFMLRVRSDGKLLSPAAVRALGADRRRLRPRHRRRHRPREHPVPLDRHQGRPRDLGAPRRGRPALDRGVRRLAAAVPRLAGRRRRRRRDHRRHLGAGGDRAPLPRQQGLLEPPPEVQDRADRAPEPRRVARRPTTSPSSAPSTPSTAPASTSGSAAACRPTRCSPRSSASGSRSTRSPTSGRASRRSSATTATAGCARAPG